MSLFDANQRQNIRVLLHPDCCASDPCTACGASEAVGGGGCFGQPPALACELWLAALRHDHNNDPQFVLHTSGFSDAPILAKAAQFVWEMATGASK